MRGVHRQYAITFAAAQTGQGNITDALGGVTYDRRSKRGMTAFASANYAVPVSVGTFTINTQTVQRSRVAGDGEALLGIVANLEENYDMAVITSGVNWLAIGNATSGGTAQTPRIGEGVLGALGSARGVTNANVSATTQGRGFVRPPDATVAAIGDVNTSLTESNRAARTMCLETVAATAGNGTRNGLARVLFL